jgi:hypothetical protein
MTVFPIYKTLYLSSVISKNMSTTLLSPSLSKTDLIDIWISYFKRRNEYEEKVIGMDSEDFEIMFNDIYNLLKYIEY